MEMRKEIYPETLKKCAGSFLGGKICKKRVHGNEKMSLPCAFGDCPGALHFTLLVFSPY